MQTTCQLCGARVILTTTPDVGGMLILLNAKPSQHGMFMIVNDAAYVFNNYPLREMIECERYGQHAATCPVWLKKREEEK